MASTRQNLRVCGWILLFFVFAQVKVHAGPIQQHSPRLVREVYPEIVPETDGNNQAQVCIVGDVVYGVEEPVPAEQPCLRCRCQPPGVLCETIKCAKKQGCKAIHRPNKCCPDYQCECHHEGRVYANGERLKSPPGGECKVCYCRGGEVQCAQVSCYVRSDCLAKTVPGQCCPKYDHCPPKEPLQGRPSNSTELNRQVLELYPLTTLLHNSSEQDSSNKIDKEQATTVLDELVKITKSTQALDFTENVRKQIEQPKITIQEIIPEVREIPITTPVAKPEQELLESANDLVTDAEPDSSEISEVFQHPPPVLRIGDKLLFLKQGELVPEKDASTPSSVITIIGAEGLQRGFEDSAEFQPSFNSNDLELKTSESTHILSLVKRKNKPEETSSSTDSVLETTPAMTEAPTTQETSSVSLSTISTEIATQTEASTLIPLQSSSTSSAGDGLVEENPAYPALPDVMGAEPGKILPEVLEARNNNTLSSNVSNNNWLKTSEGSDSLINLKAILPDEVLQARAPSDSEEASSSTESVENLESTTILPESSTSWVESVEETTLDSGEATTIPTNSTSSLALSEEDNASVYERASSEVEDMTRLETSTRFPRKLDDVEVLNKNETIKEEDEETKLDETVGINVKKEEVELIPVNQTKSEKSAEEEEKDETSRKVIEKRENSPEDEAEEVFRQLDSELSVDADNGPVQTEEEERAESSRIFQELLQETSTPKPARKFKDKDAETLERVSDAIAKLTLRGKQGNRFDASILGVISDFFGGQYRQH